MKKYRLGIDFPRPKFGSQQFAMTPGARDALEGDIPERYLDRHFSGDWGEIPDEDRPINEESLTTKGMILSAYTTRKGDKIWVITDPGHEVTTILLPSEY